EHEAPSPSDCISSAPPLPRHGRACRGRDVERSALPARRLVEEIVDLAGGFFVDARHLRKIVQRGALDGLQGAEVMQQRTLARRPDAGDFLQACLADVLLAAGAV